MIIIYRFYSIMLCLALWVSTLSAQTHWSVNPHDFQYDMTIYYTLTSGGVSVSNLGSYEVAAFVGDECRGVGKVETQTGTNGTTLTYGFLKVYSHVANGETITFKYYSDGTENDIPNQNISFESASVKGLPSSPYSLQVETSFIPGDANGDGRVSIADASLIVDYILSGGTITISAGADMNGDGKVSIADASAIVDYILSGH